ncbi:MAG: hypothetical protein R6V86_07300 [Spirochaetia bacterium]
MRQRRVFLWTMLIAAALMLLSSCMSVFDSINSTAGLVDGKVSQTKASANQAVADAVGIGALEDGMIAALVYSQAFFAGGYVHGYSDFSEGEGVVWKVTAIDRDNPEEEESIEIERALLKRTAEGHTWWLLRYSDEEGSELVSESLLDDEYDMLIFRYRDPETQKIREWKPDTSEEADESENTEDTEQESTVDAYEAAFYRGDYQDHIIGTEKIKVPAGTYTADHVRFVDVYSTEDAEGESETYEVRYEWWIDSDVPGDLVKYEWTNETEDSGIKGELLDHKQGYSTQLSSY